MKQIQQLLLGGPVLVYLSVHGLTTGPIDDRITSLVGPYLILIVGIGLSLFGLFTVFSINGLSMGKRIVIGSCYPLIATGTMALAIGWIGAAIRGREIGLLVSNWVPLLVGLVLLLTGLMLRRSID